MCACEREVCLRFVWVCVRELLFCAVVVCLSHVELVVCRVWFARVSCPWLRLTAPPVSRYTVNKKAQKLLTRKPQKGEIICHIKVSPHAKPIGFFRRIKCLRGGFVHNAASDYGPVALTERAISSLCPCTHAGADVCSDSGVGFRDDKLVAAGERRQPESSGSRPCRWPTFVGDRVGWPTPVWAGGAQAPSRRAEYQQAVARTSTPGSRANACSECTDAHCKARRLANVRPEPGSGTAALVGHRVGWPATLRARGAPAFRRLAKYQRAITHAAGGILAVGSTGSRRTSTTDGKGASRISRSVACAAGGSLGRTSRRRRASRCSFCG